MLAIERRNAILSKLYLDGKVIVSELSTEFEVTEETIRRDLEKLDKEGLVKKSYGGAVLVQNFNTDLPHSVRKKANVEANATRPVPAWLEKDNENISGKVLRLASREDIDIALEEHLIVELYSK